MTQNNPNHVFAQVVSLHANHAIAQDREGRNIHLPYTSGLMLGIAAKRPPRFLSHKEERPLELSSKVYALVCGEESPYQATNWGFAHEWHQQERLYKKQWYEEFNFTSFIGGELRYSRSDGTWPVFVEEVITPQLQKARFLIHPDTLLVGKVEIDLGAAERDETRSQNGELFLRVPDSGRYKTYHLKPKI